MKIQTPNKLTNKQPQNNLNNRKNESFKGAGIVSPFFRFLDINQAWGAASVDLGCMVIPRTAVDFTRGPDAGFETMRRESSGAANHALVGGYGLVAASLIAIPFNKQFGVRADRMFIGNETLDILSKKWGDNLNIENKTKRMDKYLNEVFDEVHGFCPTHKNADKKGWVELKTDAKRLIVERFKKELENESLSKDGKKYIKAVIMDSVNAERHLKFTKEAKGSLTVETLIENTYKLSKSFLSKNVNVENAFKKAKNLNENTYIKGLKKLNPRIAIAGLGFAALVGISTQPFNMYLTKKKTGKTGFVGVEGREPDKSTGFKFMKAFAAVGFGAMVMSLIAKKPSEILSKVQFRGFTPVLDQLKFVYGMTIMSRLISARDKNELRESTIKDSLGLLSWLVLGNFVSKLVATGVEKLPKFKDAGVSFIMHNKETHGSKLPRWLSDADIITHDEILHADLKSTIKDGKAMLFKEMKKGASDLTKSKLRWRNLIQLSGYAFSALALGMGVPKLNIAITNSIESKRKKAENAKIVNNDTGQTPIISKIQDAKASTLSKIAT